MGMETDADDNAEQDIKKETDPFRFILSEDHARDTYLATVVNVAIHLSEHLPPQYAPDIATPPPNGIA